MAKRNRERERIDQLEARLRARGGGGLSLGRDDTGLLTALELTIGMVSDPADKYRWTLGADGQALISRVFQATATVDAISQDDTPEIAQGKWRDWIG
ncbi:hypothetical protein NKI89_10225 [Mesorhizobium sp. M0309]|uniref:hypothetical protein n=1 Tax=Mesorhizobium sp. M0309 TaxID=2956933 RepID=UPI00333AA4B3